MRVLVLVAAISSGLLAQPAGAGWEAKRKGADVCFATLRPTASRNAPPDRGKVYVALTNNRREGSWDSLTFVSGYPDVTKSLPSVSFGEKHERAFELLPYGAAAFARAGRPEQEIVAAMLDSDAMRVTWRSADGKTVIVDDYDLTGIKAARAVIDQACGRPLAAVATASSPAAVPAQQALPRGNPFR